MEISGKPRHLICPGSGNSEEKSLSSLSQPRAIRPVRFPLKRIGLSPFNGRPPKLVWRGSVRFGIAYNYGGEKSAIGDDGSTRDPKRLCDAVLEFFPFRLRRRVPFLFSSPKYGKCARPDRLCVAKQGIWKGDRIASSGTASIPGKPSTLDNARRRIRGIGKDHRSTGFVSKRAKDLSRPHSRPSRRSADRIHGRQRGRHSRPKALTPPA